MRCADGRQDLGGVSQADSHPTGVSLRRLRRRSQNTEYKHRGVGRRAGVHGHHGRPIPPIVRYVRGNSFGHSKDFQPLWDHQGIFCASNSPTRGHEELHHALQWTDASRSLRTTFEDPAHQDELSKDEVLSTVSVWPNMTKESAPGPSSVAILSRLKKICQVLDECECVTRYSPRMIGPETKWSSRN